MRKSNLVFISGFFLLILLSWIINPKEKPFGYINPVQSLPLTMNTFLSTRYQQMLEESVTNKMPSLLYQLYIKNDIYTLLNLGYFYSGYKGNIARGQNGILFEKSQLADVYGKALNDEKVEQTAAACARHLLVLKQNLEKLQVALVVVMAPIKIDYFAYAAPWNFRIRSPKPGIGSEFASQIYDKYLTQAGINFVDCYEPLKRKDVAELSFPDQGTHWSMYGSALCLQKLAQKLHKIDPREFPPVEIGGRFVSTEARNSERDIADLLNVWPPYRNGRNTYDLAVFKKMRQQQIPLVIWGDSFMQQLIANMHLSGYSSAESVTYFENSFPSLSELEAALGNAKVFIIISNVIKFINPMWEQWVQALNLHFENEGIKTHSLPKK